MLFSHSVSFVFDELTMSEMKLGQLCGHSCFTTCTRITLSFVMNTRSAANLPRDISWARVRARATCRGGDVR